MLLKKAPFVTADSGVVDRTRMYFALALVDEGTKYGDNGWYHLYFMNLPHELSRSRPDHRYSALASLRLQTRNPIRHQSDI